MAVNYASVEQNGSVKIVIVRGTAADLTSANPTLSAGEPAFETDTGYMKIGDGATAWTSLTYVTAKVIGDLTHVGTKAGFYSTAPIAKPTVTGARDETEGAIKSLLTQLAALGLITDSTTAS